jgi:nucleoside-diphosphate-sugar epimerase
VLTRDATAFRRRHGRLAAAPMLDWHEGDVADFALPAGAFDLVVHAALPASTHAQDAANLVRTAAAGLQRVCAFAQQARVRRLLHVSSGAVYGAAGAPRPLHEATPWSEPAPNAYTEAKRAAERICAGDLPFEVVIARLFAFAGPYLEASGGSAAAQFTAAAAAGRRIVVQGTGEAIRSFQYPSDMARWLLTMLVVGRRGAAYNVGSDEAVSILDLARRAAAAAGTDYEVLGQSAPGLAGSYYVPDLALARDELGLANTVGLAQALRRTLAWRSALHAIPEALP